MIIRERATDFDNHAGAVRQIDDDVREVCKGYIGNGYIGWLRQHRRVCSICDHHEWLSKNDVGKWLRVSMEGKVRTSEERVVAPIFEIWLCSRHLDDGRQLTKTLAHVVRQETRDIVRAWAGRVWKRDKARRHQEDLNDA